MDFWGCEGSGATFHGLRMRSRSTRKCAHRNAGDLGSSLAVCACAYDPIHVTAQGKRLGPNCACVQSLCEKNVDLTLVCVCSLSHGVTWIFMTIYGHCDVKWVTWPKCSILIGRQNLCCALIGRDLMGPYSLLLRCFTFRKIASGSYMALA